MKERNKRKKDLKVANEKRLGDHDLRLVSTGKGERRFVYDHWRLQNARLLGFL